MKSLRFASTKRIWKAIFIEETRRNVLRLCENFGFLRWKSTYKVYFLDRNAHSCFWDQNRMLSCFPFISSIPQRAWADSWSEEMWCAWVSLAKGGKWPTLSVRLVLPVEKHHCAPQYSRSVGLAIRPLWGHLGILVFRDQPFSTFL